MKRDTRQGEKLNAVMLSQNDGDKTVKLPSGTVMPLDEDNNVRYDSVLGAGRYIALEHSVLIKRN